jgi:predicted RNA binding protein YcfA (HicA-like mRNA interferase family)
VTKRDELIARIRARPAVARFADVQGLLEEFGWQLQRETGSHVTFAKEGERSITVPKVGGRMVKRIYLDQICDRLGLDE